MARYAGTTTTARCARRSAPSAAARADGWRARSSADDNALVDREAALPRRARLVRQERQRAAPRARERGSSSARSSPTRRCRRPPRRSPTAAARASAASTACPTGAIVAPGVVDARRCLAWLVQAAGVFPVEHRVALGDRIYGCDDCQEVCPPNSGRRARAAPATRRRPTTGPWVDAARPARPPTTTSCSTATAAGTSPRREPRYLRRNALVALGNIGDGRATAGSTRCSPCAGRRRPDRARPRRLGGAPRRPRTAGRLAEPTGRRADAMVAELDRDVAAPVAPGDATCSSPTTSRPRSVASSRYLWELWRRLPAGRRRRCSPRPTPGAAGVGRRASRSASSAAASRCCCRRPALRGRIDGLAAEVGADVVCSTRRCPLGLLGPVARAARTGVVLHGAEVTVPGRLPGRRRCSRRVAARAPAGRRRRRLPGRRGRAGRRRERLPIVVVPPGVDIERFRPARRRRAAPRPAPRFGLARRTRRRPRRQPAGAAQGLRRADRRGRRLRADAVPTSSLAIAGDGPRPRPPRAAGAERRRRRSRFLGRVADDDLPAALRLPPTCSPCSCRNRWARPRAGGLRHRVPRGGRVRGAPAGRRERWIARGGRRRRHRRRRAAPPIGGRRGPGPGPAARPPRAPGPPRQRGRARVVEELTYDVLAGRLAAAITTV